jgi:hypothetical protein
MQEEQRKHGPLLGTAEREACPVRGDLQRAQDAEIELLRGLTVARSSPASKGPVRCGYGPAVPPLCKPDSSELTLERG